MNKRTRKKKENTLELALYLARQDFFYAVYSGFFDPELSKTADGIAIRKVINKCIIQMHVGNAWMIIYPDFDEIRAAIGTYNITLWDYTSINRNMPPLPFMPSLFSTFNTRSMIGNRDYLSSLVSREDGYLIKMFVDCIFKRVEKELD